MMSKIATAVVCSHIDKMSSLGQKLCMVVYPADPADGGKKSDGEEKDSST